MSADEKSLDERHAEASGMAAYALTVLHDVIFDLEKAAADCLAVVADAEREVSGLEDLMAAAEHSADRYLASAVKARALLIP